MSVSIVIPVYNERENIRPLWESLTKTMTEYGQPYEILFVDDGSRDGSVDELQSIAWQDPRVKLVLFRRNYGQTAAMYAGIQHASLDVVVTMDGDQQNDPADIPMMVEKLHEGYDLAHGWRKQRQDAWVNRKLPSKIANWLISKVTRFPVRDLGCSLKAMRREIAQELELYGEMHRFIPILASQRGARCVEVETHHRARTLGQTKYGIGRTFRVLLDLLTVKYLIQYNASPMKFFGMGGMIGMAASGLLAALAVVLKLFSLADLSGSPLLMAAGFVAVASVQLFGLGLLGESAARIYFCQSGKQTYAVRERVNFERRSAARAA